MKLLMNAALALFSMLFLKRISPSLLSFGDLGLMFKVIWVRFFRPLIIK